MDELKQNSISILELNFCTAFKVFYTSEVASKPASISLFKIKTRELCVRSVQS